MKDEQLVRKIYVKSSDDLPKDNKKYDVLWKGNDFHRMHGRTMQRYFNNIDWYLQPIGEQKLISDEEINYRFPKKKLFINCRENKYRQEGAKLMRDHPEQFKDKRIAIPFVKKMGKLKNK